MFFEDFYTSKESYLKLNANNQNIYWHIEKLEMLYIFFLIIIIISRKRVVKTWPEACYFTKLEGLLHASTEQFEMAKSYPCDEGNENFIFHCTSPANIR